MNTLKKSQKKQEPERKVRENARKKTKKQIDYAKELPDVDFEEFEPIVAEGPLTGDRPDE